MIIDAFVYNFNGSKHDVTMVSGSQATMRMYNDNSSSNVLKKEAARYSIVIACTYESYFWVHKWIDIAACVSYFYVLAIKRKLRSWQNDTAVPVTFIHGCKHWVYSTGEFPRIIFGHAPFGFVHA